MPVHESVSARTCVVTSELPGVLWRFSKASLKVFYPCGSITSRYTLDPVLEDLGLKHLAAGATA